MTNEIKAFCERLHIEYSEEFEVYYKRGKALYEKEGKKVTNEEFIMNLHNKYNIFRKWLNKVLEAAKVNEADEDLMTYIYILIEAYKDNSDVNQCVMPDFDNPRTGYAPVFSFLYFVEDIAAGLREKNIPEDIITGTIGELDDKMTDYHDIYKLEGLRFLNWMGRFIHKRILRIGRLNFEMATLSLNVRGYEKDGDIKIFMDNEEMHKNGFLFGTVGCEDEDGKYLATIEEKDDEVTGYMTDEWGECPYKKTTVKGYKEFIRKGDKFISVHIPAGASLDRESCEKAYERAVDIFAKFFPEFEYKAFGCLSWMLEKRLKEIMGKDTNITRFADKYTGFPIMSNGKSCYTFLFNESNPEVQPENLPEDTSMRKKVKDYILSGKYYNAKGGFFKI